MDGQGSHSSGPGEGRPGYASGGLRPYLREIGPLRVLGREEERALAQAMRDPARREAARERFVRHNLKLVVACARRYRHIGLPFEDLVQEGNLGLLRAAELYEPERGIAFAAYAAWWIEQAMLRAAQNQGRDVRVPAHLHGLAGRASRATTRLRAAEGSEPGAERIGEAIGAEPAEVERVRGALAPERSTSEPVAGSEAIVLGDLLAEPEPDDPGARLDRSALRAAIRRGLRRLAPRERRILAWRYGLDAEPEASLAEIGRRLGLSRERVRQLEARALARLKGARRLRRLADELDPPAREAS